jgi:hypothetical protein
VLARPGSISLAASHATTAASPATAVHALVAATAAAATTTSATTSAAAAAATAAVVATGIHALIIPAAVAVAIAIKIKAIVTIVGAACWKKGLLRHIGSNTVSRYHVSGSRSLSMLIHGRCTGEAAVKGAPVQPKK